MLGLADFDGGKSITRATEMGWALVMDLPASNSIIPVQYKQQIQINLIVKINEMEAIVLDMLGIQGSWTKYSIKRQRFPTSAIGKAKQ